MTPTQAADVYERAERLGQCERIDEAVALLSGCEQWPPPLNERGIVLRARILYRNDPISALDSLPESVDAFVTAEGRVVALSLAYLQWTRREYDPASPAMLLAVASPDPEVRTAAMNLKAWMHGGRDDYRALLSGLSDCLRLYEAYGNRCGLQMIAATLQSAADFAWEMHDVEAARLSSSVFAAMPWVESLHTERYAAVRGLAWHSWLAGESARAKMLFAQAQELAFTDAWRAMSAVDAAFIAVLTGEESQTQAAQHRANGADIARSSAGAL